MDASHLPQGGQNEATRDFLYQQTFLFLPGARKARMTLLEEHAEVSK